MKHSATRLLLTYAFLSIALLGHSAWSAEVDLNRSRQFEIEAGPASGTLQKFVTQSGVGCNWNSIPPADTQAISGSFTPSTALQRMLAGTGLKSEFVRPGTFNVFDPKSRKSEAATSTRASITPHTERDTANEEVHISGTRPYQSAPGEHIIALSARDIDFAGFASAADLLRTRPQVFGGGPSEDTHEIGSEASTNPGRGYGINLRGLGAGSTLVLLDGHRLAVGGLEGAFTDVSSLPLTALEGIQINATGSSIRYGSDAVGGIVNFQLQRLFDGRSTSGHFGSTTRNDLTEQYVTQLLGANTDFGHFMLSLDYYTRDELKARNRPQVTSDLRRFGGTDFSQATANPGTIIAGGHTWGIPQGQDGTALDAASLLRDVPNRKDKYKGVDLLPRHQRRSAVGAWTFDINEALSLSADAVHSYREVRGVSAPAAGNIAVPPSNPFYVDPTGTGGPVSVGYDFGEDLGPILTEGGVTTDNYAVWAEWHFTPSWQVVPTVAYASETLDFDFFNTLDLSALPAALLDPNPETALNLFGDGSHTNPKTLDKLRARSKFGSRSFLKSLNLTANGTLTALPAGNASLMAGAEYREQSFSSAVRATVESPAVVQASVRTVSALFAEVTLPFFSELNRQWGIEHLVASAGLRYEKYSDFAGMRTPRYAIEWAPSKSVKFDASWMRSLRAPTLMDLNESGNAASFTFLPDPTAPGGRAAVLAWTGKNSDLRAETASSWTLGVEYAPPWKPYSMAATYFHTNFRDRLSFPGLPADALTNPLFANIVTRNPSADQVAFVCGRAPITTFTGTCSGIQVDAIADLRLRNDAKMVTRGFDFKARYAHELGKGTLSLGIDGTYIIEFSEATSRDPTLRDRVSTQNYPIDLRLRGSAAWQHGAFESAMSVNFANHYRDMASVPVRSVNSMTTVDLNFAYLLFDEQHGAGLGDTQLSFAVQNLFDQQPPFLNNAVGIGYDQENADIIGRVVSVTIRTRW